MDIERLTARNKNGLAYLVKVKPIKTEFDDGQRWWYCPICRAGWQQYKNYPDNWASDKARMCINHHITEKREGKKK